MKIPEQHTMTKSETHLIESSNSSIRDNLARFNRKSKRFSKSFSFLDFTLQLFFYKHFLFTAPTPPEGIVQFSYFEKSVIFLLFLISATAILSHSSFSGCPL